MTSEEVFVELLEKVNKNSANDNISFDKPRLKLAVNTAQNKFLEKIIEKRNSSESVYIEKFLIPNVDLKEAKKTKESQYFALPIDFFNFVDLAGVASSGSCKDAIKLWEAKPHNVNELLFDANNKPSFYFRETFYYIADEKIRVFRDDFLIDSLALTYYRYPRVIDIEGYIDANGIHSSTIHPEWDDKSMERIIAIAAKDLNVNTENLQTYQIDNNQINSKQ